MQAERRLKVQGRVSGRTEQLTPHIALLTLVFLRRLLHLHTQEHSTLYSVTTVHRGREQIRGFEKPLARLISE